MRSSCWVTNPHLAFLVMVNAHVYVHTWTVHILGQHEHMYCMYVLIFIVQNGFSPLYSTSRKDRDEMVEILLRGGANPNQIVIGVLVC